MKMKNRRINVHIYNRTYRYMLTDEAKSKQKTKERKKETNRTDMKIFFRQEKARREKTKLSKDRCQRLNRRRRRKRIDAEDFMHGQRYCYCCCCCCNFN